MNKYHKNIYSSVKDTDDLYNLKPKMTVCFCPRCEKTHTKNFLWTGRGIPRKFCGKCKDSLPFFNEDTGIAELHKTSSIVSRPSY